MLEFFLWFRAKKHLVLLVTIDIIIISILFISNDKEILSFYNISFITTNWLFWNYLLGRYSIFNYSENNLFLKDIFRVTLSFLAFYLTIIVQDYLFNNFYKSAITDLTSFNMTIFFSSYIAVSSYKYFYKIFDFNLKTHEWIYLGINDNTKLLNCLNKFSNKKFKIIFCELDGLKDKRLLNKKKQGIILEDPNIINYKDGLFLSKERNKGTKIINQFNWFEQYLQFYPVDLLKMKDINDINFSTLKSSFHTRLKRVSDILVSLIILFFSAPIIIFSSILIKLYDGGPIFYSQIRNGYQGKPFRIWKLRTMINNAEEDGIQWSSANDQRITPVGKILRASRLDEIPQLISVIRGEMSLIGPRPERPEIEEELKKKINFYDIRKFVRPGLSGWAQVNYPYGASIEDAKYKLGFEIFYIKNFSTILDLIILFKTIRLVFNLAGSKPLNHSKFRV